MKDLEKKILLAILFGVIALIALDIIYFRLIHADLYASPFKEEIALITSLEQLEKGIVSNDSQKVSVATGVIRLNLQH